MRPKVQEIEIKIKVQSCEACPKMKKYVTGPNSFIGICQETGVEIENIQQIHFSCKYLPKKLKPQ